MTDKVVFLHGEQSIPDPDKDRAEALQTMKDCLSIVSGKVEADEIDGMIVVTFNRNNTSEDYLVGQLNMSEVTHVLNCLLVNNILMTQITFKDLEN